MPILLPVTDNCPTWISGRERMAVEMISWPICMKECFVGRGSNRRPSEYQGYMHLTELLSPAKNGTSLPSSVSKLSNFFLIQSFRIKYNLKILFSSFISKLHLSDINFVTFVLITPIMRITVMILSFRTNVPGQTVQIQIRLLLEEQSLLSIPYGRATKFKF